jgi:hypothetical protein
VRGLAWQAPAEDGAGLEAGDEEELEDGADAAAGLVLDGRGQRPGQAANSLFRRLFGRVLPNHPSLTEKMEFHGVDSRWIELLVSSIPSTRRIRRLRLPWSTPLDPSCGQAFGDMVGRNVQVHRLHVGSLEVAGCKKICDSVPANDCPRELHLDCADLVPFPET